MSLPLSSVRALLALLVLAAPVAAQTSVFPGDSAVQGARLTPGVMVRGLYLDRGTESRRSGQITDRLVRSADGTRLVREQVIAFGAGGRTDSAEVDARTLAPIRHAGRGNGQTLVVRFDGRRAIAEETKPSGATARLDSTYATAMFDSNIYDLVLAALPLEAGYAVTLPIYIYERGGLVAAAIVVTGEDAVRVGDREVRCWVVTATWGGRTATHWVGQEDRRIWKLTSAAGPGATFRMQAEP